MKQLFAVLMLTLFFGAAYAQDSGDVERWADAAERAEQVIGSESATEGQLTTLRELLSDQRSEALEVQDQYRDRIATMEAQIAALGPEPAEGETEDAAITERRAELRERLTLIRAPVVDAEQAYSRADGLIDEIDSTLRARNAAFLLRLDQSPLWPATAFSGLAELQNAFATGSAAFIDEVFGAISDPVSLRRFPVLIVALIAAVVLFFNLRSRVVADLASEYSAARSPARRAVIGFLLSATRLIVPLVAVFLVIGALRYVSPDSYMINRVSSLVMALATWFAVALWLSRTIFVPENSDLAVVPSPPAYARSGQRQSMVLGLVVAAFVVVNGSYRAEGIGTAGLGVATLPLVLIASFALLRLARVLRERDGPEGNAAPFLKLLARAAWILAIAAPIASAIGYQNLAQFLTIPTIQSLALIGGLAVVFAIIRDSLDRWLDAAGNTVKQSERARFRLLPVLFGFALVSLGIPILVLIWGARTSDLQEIWIWLRDGVSIGDSRISVADFVTFVLIFVVGYTLTRMLQAITRNTVLPRTDIDVGGRNAIVTGIGYVGIFLSAMFAISFTGLNLSNVAIVAGALSVGIGFGLQTIVSNFVSGIILLIERPIKEGDWIEVAGFAGYVRRISVRSTQIQTFDRSSVIVPNAELIAGSVLNRTHGNLMGRVIAPVGVAYGTDAAQVERILLEIAESHSMVLRTPEPSVIFQGFGADSLDFEIRAFIRDVNYMLSVKSELNHKIYQRFTEEGIEIPFRQSDITLKNPDILRDALAGKGEDDDTSPVSG